MPFRRVFDLRRRQFRVLDAVSLVCIGLCMLFLFHLVLVGRETANRLLDANAGEEEGVFPGSNVGGEDLTNTEEKGFGEDLEHSSYDHQQHFYPLTQCDAVVGYGIIDAWKDSMAPFCEPRGDSLLSREVVTSLRCGKTQPSLAPPATLPHTLCAAHNLLVDFGQISPSEYIRYRPQWMRSDAKSLHLYEKGALSGCGCVSDPHHMVEKSFPADHLRDIFMSWRDEIGDDNSTHGVCSVQPDEIIETPVLFVTREYGEHLNVFHALTDMIATFQTMQVFELVGRPVALLFLDHHHTSPFDELWKRAFHTAGKERNGGNPWRARDWVVKKSSVRFKEAFFVPPGYTSFLFYSLYGDYPICKDRTAFMQDFSLFLQESMGIQHEKVSFSSSTSMQITFVSRQPYKTANTDHVFMDRMVSNEDEVIKALRERFPSSTVQKVDFARIPYNEQARTAGRTDIMIGFHGAGLAHLLYLPPWAGLVEIMKEERTWRCYDHMSHWRGLEYVRYLAAPQDTKRGADGSYTHISVDTFLRSVQGIYDRVLEKKSL